MDIKALPTGAHCLVDANIFIYHLGQTSLECRQLITRIARTEITAYMTTIIIAEVLHRRMMAEALAKGVVTAGQPLKKLKADPALITGLTDYITEVEDLLLLPFSVLEVTAADIKASHAVRQTNGMFVNDSINLACATRFGITNVVTHDSDFARVAGINVWSPTDV